MAAFAEFLWGSFHLDRYQPVELDTHDDELGLRLLAVALRQAGEDVPLPWLTDWLAQYRRQLRLLAGYPLAERTEVRALLLLASLAESEVDIWRRVIGPGLDIRRLGGGHFDLLRPRWSPRRPGRSPRWARWTMARVRPGARLTVIVGTELWHHRPVSHEIVRRARAARLAGATVLRGVEGFGSSGVVHTAGILALADNCRRL